MFIINKISKETYDFLSSEPKELRKNVIFWNLKARSATKQAVTVSHRERLQCIAIVRMVIEILQASVVTLIIQMYSQCFFQTSIFSCSIVFFMQDYDFPLKNHELSWKNMIFHCKITRKYWSADQIRSDQFRSADQIRSDQFSQR